MEFIQSLLSAGKKRLASQINFTYRYIDVVLSIDNSDFENNFDQMYPPGLEIKDTTESNTSASYLSLLLSIGRDGQLCTSLHDKRDEFNIHITNFPFLRSNISSSPAYGVFISQLIRYARACSSYECFILRAMRLSNKLLEQGYVKKHLRSSLRKFYGQYGDLIKQYEVPFSRMLHDILEDDHIQWHAPLIITSIFDSVTDPDLTTEFDFLPYCMISIEHLQRVRNANRGRLLLRAPGPVPLWDLHVFLCWDQFLLNLSYFRTSEFRTSLVTSVLLWSISVIISGFKNGHPSWQKSLFAFQLLSECNCWLTVGTRWHVLPSSTVDLAFQVSNLPAFYFIY